MPYNLNLPAPLPNDGWKVKIFDGEPDYEEPHVTVVRRTKTWRYSLRDREFMDEKPPPRDVDDEVMEAIHDNWETLVDEWNDRYPNNPV